MRRFVALSTVIAVFLLPLAACILDPKPSEDPPVIPPKNYEDLSKKEHVLINLELAYNQRDLEEYQRLLDTDFLFFFADVDVNDPTDPAPKSWGAQEEIDATRNIFDRNYKGDEDPVTKIDLDLQFPPIWTPITPEDQVKYPGETWYTNVPRYNLFVETAGPTDYQSVDIQAEFVIRFTEVAGDSIWRIVSWRDIGTSTQ